MAALGSGSTPRTVGAIAGLAVLLLACALVGVLAAVLRTGGCYGVEAGASARADQEISARYLELYRSAARDYGVPWAVLAGIGAIETDHGRSDAPGVRSGVNRHGCCAGPMQFNLTDGPPSTWERYAVDGNHDGCADVYDPADAIPSAAHYLHALLEEADGDLRQALLGYNPLPHLRHRSTRARPGLRALAGRRADGPGRRLCRRWDRRAGRARRAGRGRARLGSPRVPRAARLGDGRWPRRRARGRAPVRRSHLDPAARRGVRRAGA